MGKQFHGMTKVSCSGFCCTKIDHFGVHVGHAEILRDVSMHVHCGELTALIGPNGAGKSTLLKAMLGEIPHTGDLHFLSASGRHAGNPIIGYVPQTLNLDRTAPANVLDLFIAAGSGRPAWLPASARQKRRVGECLERVGAEHLANRRLGALSGGELQRVLLAMALEPIPDLLLLDEPVSGVDQNGMKAFYDQVSALRATYDLSIIMVTHDIDLIPSYADRVVLLDHTVLANGSPEEVFGSESFRSVFPAHATPSGRSDGLVNSESDQENGSGSFQPDPADGTIPPGRAQSIRQKASRYTIEQLNALKNGKEETP